MIVIALMAAVAVWLLLADGNGAAGQPSTAGIAGSEATAQPPASEPPSEMASEPRSTTTEETRAERLARLRKTDAFVEFANWDRARAAPNYERALGAFSWYDPGRDSHVGFINAKRLWNDIAPPVRDDLLLTGPEYRGPILDDRVRGGITGSYERRGEESQLIAFLAPFKDLNGVPMGRVNAVLIDVSDQQGDEAYARGRLLARMKPFTVAPEDYTTNADLAERGISPRLRSWAQEHGG
jgi:hypothetical protein